MIRMICPSFVPEEQHAFHITRVPQKTLKKRKKEKYKKEKILNKQKMVLKKI